MVYVVGSDLMSYRKPLLCYNAAIAVPLTASFWCCAGSPRLMLADWLH